MLDHNELTTIIATLSGGRYDAISDELARPRIIIDSEGNDAHSIQVRAIPVFLLFK
jgi:hypothetical protein